MLTEFDLSLSDGRTMHVYDTDPGGADSELAVVWHHGTPNLGAPPEPLVPAAAERGLRWVSFDRPGYGGSTRLPGRNIGSVADDVQHIADALGLARFAVMGHSGGGPRALACAALLPDRVVAAVSGAGLAPFDADGLDWFAGMAPAGAAELRAAVDGPEKLRQLLEATEFDPEQFTPADHQILTGPWGWLGSIAEQALDGGLDGMIDDDRAYVTAWGFDPERIETPTLLLHGEQDRVVPSAHSTWLAHRIGPSELWLRRGDGHISVLASAVDALDWLVDQSSG
ncbi:alpha/beta fold hydrolase [Phytoactinopolyspora halotolerans]|uniref:Alpha/beta hydrolase n=1 Tax=Phytoactinopolyspora halotolerans TaxID=1981512 RepID=A0A6L9S5X2_9ACTN|nr:alpha/beta hydrolase [Phytoactinopolyspora halotolerans]NEE00141.1 alpha/beta hydrolase [Phytoactinopolyspora halotolerans]